MNFVKKALQVQRAVKNVGRMKVIVGTMSRYGYSSVVKRMGLANYLDIVKSSTGTRLREKSQAERLRLMFQELGPTFIKMGQILAGRPDLIPSEFTKEFQKLQDNVTEVPFSEIKKTLESELKKECSELFSSLDPHPLGTASIAQVHAARTLKGEDVVVKVVKPHVDEILKQDLEILSLIADLAEEYIEEIKFFRPKRILEEFQRTLLTELNLRREAFHMDRYRKNFEKSTFIKIPTVYHDLCTENVLCMERIHGSKLQEISKLQEQGIDTIEVMRKGMDHHLEAILVHGFFHADPHGGNIFVLPDGRMSLIDFGSVGFLSPESKDAIVNMFLALIAEDYGALINEYVALSPPHAQSRSSKKIDELQREIGKIFGPYYGLPLKEIPASELMLEGASMAYRHQIVLPQDLLLVFKSNITLEGLARQLDPDFDLLSSASKFAQLVLKEKYNPERFLKSSLYTLRSLHAFLRNTPRYLNETLRQIESGEARLNVDLKAPKDLLKMQSRNSKRLCFSLCMICFWSTATALLFHPIHNFWPPLLFSCLAILCFLKVLRT